MQRDRVKIGGQELQPGQTDGSSTYPLEQKRICSSGNEIYETQIPPQVEEGNRGKIVAIYLDTKEKKCPETLQSRKLKN